MRNTLPDAAKHPVNNSFMEFIKSNWKSNETFVWDRIQSELQCCGVYGHVDYRRLATAYSFSCSEDSTSATPYQRGCLSVLSYEARQRLLYTALISALTAVILVRYCFSP